MNILYLDVLRVCATFAVVFLHAAASDFYTADIISYDFITSVIYDGLLRWCVPCFVMLSGALLLDPQKEVTIESVLKKRISRLLFAYVFWVIVYAVFKVGVDVFKDGTLNFSLSMFYPHFHLWFLPMLMGVYIFIPFLKCIVCNIKLVNYALILWLLYLIGTIFFKDIPQMNIFFLRYDIIGYIGYFLCGYFVSVYAFNKKQRNIIYLLGIVGVIITIVGTLLLSSLEKNATEVFFDPLNLNVVFTSIAVFVFCKYNCNLNFKIIKFINYVKKDLFGIYLVHCVFLSALNKLHFRDLCNDVISIPLLAVLVFALSLYCIKFMRKINIVKKFVE